MGSGHGQHQAHSGLQDPPGASRGCRTERRANVGTMGTCLLPESWVNKNEQLGYPDSAGPLRAPQQSSKKLRKSKQTTPGVSFPRTLRGTGCLGASLLWERKEKGRRTRSTASLSLLPAWGQCRTDAAALQHRDTQAPRSLCRQGALSGQQTQNGWSLSPSPGCRPMQLRPTRNPPARPE